MDFRTPLYAKMSGTKKITHVYLSPIPPTPGATKKSDTRSDQGYFFCYTLLIITIEERRPLAFRGEFSSMHNSLSSFEAAERDRCVSKA